MTSLKHGFESRWGHHFDFVGLFGAVSDRPGLGADPTPDVLTRYPYGAQGRRPFYLT